MGGTLSQMGKGVRVRVRGYSAPLKQRRENPACACGDDVCTQVLSN